MTLLSDRPLQAGWNRVYYHLQGTTTAIHNAALVPTASLSLGSQRLVAAVDAIQPDGPLTGLSNLQHERFVSALTFPQPGLANADWTLQVDVSLPGQPSATFDFGPLQVLPAPWVRTLQAPGDHTAERYVVALCFPYRQQLGSNEYRLAIYRQQGPLQPFLPLSSARLEVALDMPSMGHAANRLNPPQWFSGAIYQGKLTMQMPGEWRMTVQLYDGTKTLDSVTFVWKI